jgi:hypothetical protein
VPAVTAAAMSVFASKYAAASKEQNATEAAQFSLTPNSLKCSNDYAKTPDETAARTSGY